MFQTTCTAWYNFTLITAKFAVHLTNIQLLYNHFLTDSLLPECFLLRILLFMQLFLFVNGVCMAWKPCALITVWIAFVLACADTNAVYFQTNTSLGMLEVNDLYSAFQS